MLVEERRTVGKRFWGDVPKDGSDDRPAGKRHGGVLAGQRSRQNLAGRTRCSKQSDASRASKFQGFTPGYGHSWSPIRDGGAERR